MFFRKNFLFIVPSYWYELASVTPIKETCAEVAVISDIMTLVGGLTC